MSKYRTTSDKWVGRSTLNGGSLLDGDTHVPRYVWNEDVSPFFKTAKNTYLAGLAAIDDVRQTKAKLAESKRYTQEGLRAKLASIAVDQQVSDLAKVRSSAVRLRAELNERKSKLTLPPVDKSDVIGEMQRAELRSHLRSIPEAKRREYVAKNKSPAMLEAILNADPQLSGLSEITVEHYKKIEVEKLYGNQFEELEEMKSAVKAVEAVTEISRDAIRSELSLNKSEFEHLVGPVEKAAGAPRFKVQSEYENGETKEVLRVLDLNAGTWRKATNEEVALYHAK